MHTAAAAVAGCLVAIMTCSSSRQGPLSDGKAYLQGCDRLGRALAILQVRDGRLLRLQPASL